MIPQLPGQNHKNVKRIKHCYNSSGYPQGWSRQYHFKFLKAVFHKFYLVHSWIPWPIYFCRRLRALFVSRAFVEFSLKPLCPTMTGKYFQIFNFQITGHLDLPVKKLNVHFSHGHSFPGPYHHSPEGNYLPLPISSVFLENPFFSTEEKKRKGGNYGIIIFLFLILKVTARYL